MADLFQPGAAFQQYAIVRMIGAGGIGEVYEARHTFLQRAVAIKFLRMRRSLSPELAQRMAKEAQALCQLDHPNIIRIYDAGFSGELVYMVTELLEGLTLRDRLERDGSLPLGEALRLHADWADALGAVHGTRLIHRDLKPENVFITTEGLAKLLDFGAALDPAARITVQGTTVGTPAYMAPEHVNQEDLDGRADIYAFGVMLYESLSGRHPFVKSDDVWPEYQEFFRRHLVEPWPKLSTLLPGIPPDVERIVDRALAKDRTLRWGSMAEVRDALRSALGALGAGVRIEPRSRPSFRTMRQPRLEVAVTPQGGTAPLDVVVPSHAAARSFATSAPTAPSLALRPGGPGRSKTTFALAAAFAVLASIGLVVAVVFALRHGSEGVAPNVSTTTSPIAAPEPPPASTAQPTGGAEPADSTAPAAAEAPSSTAEEPPPVSAPPKPEPRPAASPKQPPPAARPKERPGAAGRTIEPVPIFER